MAETPVTTMDLVDRALEGNPSQLSDIFNNLVMPKIADVVSARKQELSHSMFNQADDDEAEESDEQEDDEDEDDEEEQLENEVDNDEDS